MCGEGRNPFGGNGASESEMGLFDRDSDRFAESLLASPSSVPPGEGDGETVTFVRALRAAIPEQPDPALEAELGPALAVAAHGATLDAGSAGTTTITAPAAAPRWRLRVAALAACLALIPILPAGLALAGMTLPGAVDDAYDAVGVNLPNQTEDPGVAAGAHDRAGDGNAGSGSKADDEATGTNESGQPAGSNAGKPENAGKPNHGNGSDNGQGNGPPEHAGPEGTAPGQGGTPPGQGETPPGNAGVPTGGGSEGSTGPPADAGPPGTPPGQGGTPPGQGGTPPGQAGE